MEALRRLRLSHAARVPEHWREGYAKLAMDLELPVTDAAEATERVRALVARIQAAS